MNKQQALEKLKETNSLTTALLKPLGIGFETWLRFCQLDKAARDELTVKLISAIDNG